MKGKLETDSSSQIGIWGFIKFSKETVKKVCEISYGYSKVAVEKLDDVRVKGLKNVSEYMANDEERAKMVYFSAKFVKNATLYAFKEAANLLIPGGRAFSRIFSETVREIEKESRNNNTIAIDSLNGADVLESRELKFGSENGVQVNSFAHQTPEDVLRVFMMMEFMRTRYLNSLLVSDHRQQKEVSSFAHQTPEDVLRVFMMMEFMRTHYLNSLLVSDHRQQKEVS